MNLVELGFAKERNVPIASVTNVEAHGRKNDAMISDDYKNKAFDICTESQTRAGLKYTLQSIVTPKILNPMLATLSDEDTILNILKLKVFDFKFGWKNVIYGDIVYDRQSEKFIELDKVKNEHYDESRFVICGECAELLLMKFGQEHIKRSLMLKYKIDNIEPIDQLINTIEEMKHSATLTIDDETKIDFFENVVAKRGTQGKKINVCGIEFYENSTILQSILRSNYCLLDELYRNPGNLQKFIMTKLYVLPNAFRPSGTVSSDPITKKYIEVLREVNNYNITKTSQCNIGFMVQSYNNVQRAVTRLFKLSKGVGDTSLLDKVTHKEGIIRESCLGERIDYSARSVITMNSKLRTGWIGLPRKIAFKIFESILVREMELQEGINRKEYLENRTIEEMMKDVEIFNGAPVLIGRQPTLFYLGIQRRLVEIIDGNAIQVSPLDCTAFGADFDGDTMHIEAFIDMSRYKDTNNNYITSEYNGKIFYDWAVFDEYDEPFKGRIQYVYPKDGKPTRELKQDITYGLVTALGFYNTERMIYNETNYKGDPAEDEKEAIKLIEQNKLSPYELVNGCDYTIAQAIIGSTLDLDESKWKYLTGKHLTSDGVKDEKEAVELINAGMLPKTVSVAEANQVAAIKKLNIDDTLLSLFNEVKERSYLIKLDTLKNLGFAISKVFPPDLDIISSDEINKLLGIDYSNEVNTTKDAMINSLNSPFIADGDDTSVRANYKRLHTYEDKLQKAKLINGWTGVIKSGARGKMENIQQTMLTKGFINNCSDNIVCNVVMSNYANGITNYENFVIANGGRAALVDKSISTAEPGYLSRKLSYCCSNIVINGDSCDTEETVPVSLDIITKTQKYLKHFYDNGKETIIKADAYKFFKTHLLGRYIRTLGGDVKITKDNIQEYFNKMYDNGETINLYSPIFCSNRCCRKCYGDDIRGLKVTDKERVGYVAAQSVSEPSTQLTMKKFQKGGIETDEDLSSAISLLEKMLNGTALLEGLYYGDQYKENTVSNKAIKTLYEILNLLWNNEGKVNMKHIEVVISALIRFVQPELGAGKGYVRNDKMTGIPVFYGLDQAIKLSANAIERIAFEDLAHSLSTSLLTSNLNEDSIIEKICFGELEDE